MFRWFRKRRRQRIAQEPFPREWLHILERDVPLYRRLSAADREELRGDVQVLLEEKSFEGCGIRVLDHMRVIIAANAAVLLLHRETDYYPGLGSIVLYPRTYRGRYRDMDEAGVVTDGEEERLGESWELGSVVLSWHDVMEDARHGGDGFNVTIHEFAHQLDAENGEMDGAPRLQTSAAAREYRRVFTGEYDAFVQRVERGEDTPLDPYGAEHPAEFFSVAVEAFFETPRMLRAEHPGVYEQLKLYFRQDPEAWGNG